MAEAIQLGVRKLPDGVAEWAGVSTPAVSVVSAASTSTAGKTDASGKTNLGLGHGTESSSLSDATLAPPAVASEPLAAALQQPSPAPACLVSIWLSGQAETNSSPLLSA